jgi:hypothetical protein
VRQGMVIGLNSLSPRQFSTSMKQAEAANLSSLAMVIRLGPRRTRSSQFHAPTSCYSRIPHQQAMPEP